MDIAETFADDTTRQLIERTPLMRLAYTAPDGSPRVIPSGYVVRDAKLIFGTIPTSAKIKALRADPRVAVTIDEGGMPPCALLLRGTAEIEIVDGVTEDYLETGRRGMTAEQYESWEQGVRAMYDSMAMVTITPTWVKLLDFERTMPEDVERLAREKGLAG